MDLQTYEIMRGIDMSKTEAQLALQCAPFIMGIKPSNLFVTDGGTRAARTAVNALEQNGYRYLIMSNGSKRATFFVYDYEYLGRTVMTPDASELLRLAGYGGLGLRSGSEHEPELMGLLLECCLRYERYMKEGGGFPHELGIFLGYPAEDVAGFIVNQGKNALYTGYWKVYRNLPKKLEIFKRYEEAQRELLRAVEKGTHLKMRELLR